MHVFAHSYSQEQKERQHSAVLKLFLADAEAQDYQYASQVLNIDALLVDRRDPVWKSRTIEQSGYYRLREQSRFYKIYSKVSL